MCKNKHDIYHRRVHADDASALARTSSPDARFGCGQWGPHFWGNKSRLPGVPKRSLCQANMKSAAPPLVLIPFVPHIYIYIYMYAYMYYIYIYINISDRSFAAASASAFSREATPTTVTCHIYIYIYVYIYICTYCNNNINNTYYCYCYNYVHNTYTII